MNRHFLKNGFLVALLFLLLGITTNAQKKSFYHQDWIDFNKNGLKDIFEDPSQNIDKRVNDLLSQMTLDEKTCQCATLYGFKRVMKDELPTPEWKNEIWKDGIANIDEQLNGLISTQYSFPFSKHAEAINTMKLKPKISH